MARVNGRQSAGALRLRPPGEPRAGSEAQSARGAGGIYFLTAAEQPGPRGGGQLRPSRRIKATQPSPHLEPL